MKGTVCLLGLVLTANVVLAQVREKETNEKDTTVTTVVGHDRSIELVAVVMPDFIELSWTKGPHDLSTHFEIYRSADGIAYHLIKQFHPQSFAANDLDFEYRDEDPLQGRNYYRLVRIEQGSQERRSMEIVADYKNHPRKIQPTLITKGNQLYVQNYDGEELRLWVFNTGGTPLVQDRVITSTTVNIPETLSRGAYVYQLVNRQQMVVARGKFVIL